MPDIIIIVEANEAPVTVVEGASPAEVVVITDGTVTEPSLITEGGRVGPAGPPGKSGITVSSVPPSNPLINDLWFEV